MDRGMGSGTRVDALVFDVGGVIVAHQNRLIYEALAARCDVAFSGEKVEAVIRNQRWDRGEAPIADLFAELQRDLGYAGTWAEFLDDWCCHFTLDAPMLALIQALATDHRVILFSNTNKEHWTFVVSDVAPAIGTFERYLSFEMGVAKPAVEAYRHIAESAKITPSRSLFFDDRSENVEGARAAGFRAERFEGEPGLRALLIDEGLLPG